MMAVVRYQGYSPLLICCGSLIPLISQFQQRTDREQRRRLQTTTRAAVAPSPWAAGQRANMKHACGACRTERPPASRCGPVKVALLHLLDWLCR